MLSTAEIKKFIDDDILSKKKKFAQMGQRYYEAEHDILRSRLFYFDADGKLVEDKVRSNVKICHPFFTELSDQLGAYIMSFQENPIRAKAGKDTTAQLQGYLDEYFDDEFWAETEEWIIGTYSKGFEYLYGKRDDEGKLKFFCADSIGVVEVEARYASDNQDHMLYWYVDKIDKEGNKVVKIMDWDATSIAYYMREKESADVVKDRSVAMNPRPHVIETDPKTKKSIAKPFGFIPFWRLDNNKKQVSGLKPIKHLIDDYDMMQCGLTNNLADFDTPLHVVTGFDGDNLDELQKNIKTKKIIGVGEGGDVEVRTIAIPYEARKVKADEDEKNIYRFGMGFNSSAMGDGNITNVVIRSRYTLLDLKAKKLTKRLKTQLKKIVKVVLDEINTENKTDFKLSDVEFKFEYNIMTNETENKQNALVEANTRQVEINTILNVAAQVGDEQTLKAICDVMDWNFEELQDEIEKLKAEQETLAAKKALNKTAVDEEAEPVE